MEYEGTVIRPPAEADSILLQATVGCSHNACAFCGAYLHDRHRVRSLDEIRPDLDWAARYLPNNRRLFLLSGDAFSAPTDFLLDLLALIRERLPAVRRIAAYASAKGLLEKTVPELTALCEAGLSTAHVGLESGDEDVLRSMNKGVDLAGQVEGLDRLKAAGIKRSVTVLLGLAGPAGSEAHARKTGEALGRVNPEYAAALTLMLLPKTRLHARRERG